MNQASDSKQSPDVVSSLRLPAEERSQDILDLKDNLYESIEYVR